MKKINDIEYLVPASVGGLEKQLNEVRNFLRKKHDFNREEKIDSGLEKWIAVEIFQDDEYLQTYEYKQEENGDLKVKIYI